MDRNWNPENYRFDFPDVPPYEGPAIKMPLIHKISKVRHFIVDEILSEASRCIEAKAELAALILSLAAVDYLTGFFVGKQSSRRDYISFMRRYFPPDYAPYLETLYDQLRSGLMHNLVALNPWKKSRISFEIRSWSKDHLQQSQSGETVFSVVTFIEDFRRAWWIYAHDIIMKGEENSQLVDNFKKRFDRLDGQGALMVRTPD